VLIDCDTCTVRGQGCDDCVVTVLLGAPPGWGEAGPVVVPLTRRPSAGTGAAVAVGDEATGAPAARSADTPGGGATDGDLSLVDAGSGAVRPVVELDEVERRAVRALADFGLVPPLRHQDASTMNGPRPRHGDRHVS
jgi:hypothetical protein